MATINDDMVVQDSPPKPCRTLKAVVVREIKLIGHWIRCS